MASVNIANVSLQDMELAVLYAYNPPGSGEEAAAVKQQATRICDELKRSPEGWRAALQLFSSASRPEAKFFALSALQEFLGPRPGIAPRVTAVEQRTQIRMALLSWLESPANPLESAEGFLRTKLAVVLALLTKADYPRSWGSAFADMVAFLPRGPAYIDLFLRYLCAVDEEIVAFHIDRTREEVESNALIKDSLRASSPGADGSSSGSGGAGAAAGAAAGGTSNGGTPGGSWLGGREREAAGGGGGGVSVVGRVVEVLSQVVAAYWEGPQASLAVFALDVCQRFIGWIDIAEVANERFLLLFRGCLRSRHSELCCAACGCLQEMVNKGMEDPLDKLSLLRRVEPLAMVREAHMEDGDVAAKAAQLIDATAQQLFQCWDKLEPQLQAGADGGGVLGAPSNGGGSQHGMPSANGGGNGGAARLQDTRAAATVAAGMLAEVMPLLWTCLSHEQVEVAEAMVPTVARLLQTLKRQTQASTGKGGAAGAAAISPAISAAAAAAGAAASQGSIVNGVGSGAGAGGYVALNYVPQLLAILYRRMRYPPDFGFDANDEDEGEEEMLRVQLRKAFVNVGRLCPEPTLEFLCAALSALPATPGQLPWPDAEAALRLLYHYSEACAGASGAARLLKEGAFPQMVLALHTSDVSHHSHPHVLMLYYELTVRYSKILRSNPGLIPSVMEALCGPRGLLHPHRLLRTRCCYFLSKLIKEMGKMGGEVALRDYVDTVVPGIQALLAAHAFGFAGGPAEPTGGRPGSGGGGGGSGASSGFGGGGGGGFGNAGVNGEGFSVYCSMNGNGHGGPNGDSGKGEEQGLGEEACLNLFETMGYLIGMQGVPVEKQMRYLESILTPQYLEVQRLLVLAMPEASKEDSEATGASLARSVAAVANVSKGFNKTQEELVPIFSQLLEAAAAALLAMPAHEAVRAKTIFLVHRMVPCLGPRMLPCVGPVAHTLIQHCDGRDIMEVMQMLERLVSKFGADFSPLMDALFLPLTQKVFDLMPAVAASAAAAGAAATPAMEAAAARARAAGAAAAVAGSALDGGAVPASPGGTPSATAPLAHEVAERLSLSRLFFAFLVTLTSSGVEGILASPTNVGRLQDVLGSMVAAIASGEDPQGAKSCVTALSQLVCKINDVDVTDRGGGPANAAAAAAAADSKPAASSAGAASMDPAVRRAIITFVAEQALPALLAHLLGPAFNPRDAASSAVLTQAGPLLFQLRRAGGGSAAFFQVAVVQANVPEAAATELAAAVAAARDEKSVGTSLKGFVSHLRAQR